MVPAQTQELRRFAAYKYQSVNATNAEGREAHLDEFQEWRGKLIEDEIDFGVEFVSSES